jgi:hypothetical protein
MTTAERYARAATNGRTTIQEQRCDADTLLAAGYAASGNERKKLALRLYRMQVVGDRSSLHHVASEAQGWLAGRMARKGGRPIPAMQREELVTQALRWWLAQACGYCGGLGYQVVEGTPNLSTEECMSCHGSGKTPLKRVIPGQMLPHAEWLVREFDTLTAVVIGDMAVLLRDDLSLV